MLLALRCTVSDMNVAIPGSFVMTHVSTTPVPIFLLPTYYVHMCVCKMCLRGARSGGGCGEAAQGEGHLLGRRLVLE